MFIYTPGPKARAEYLAFSKREQMLSSENRGVSGGEPRHDSHPRRTVTPQLASADSELFHELTKRGIGEAKALRLVENLRPGQHIIDQLEWGDEILRKAKPGTFRNPPGLLIRFIEENLTPPEYFESSRRRKLREQAEAERRDEQAKRLQLELAYENYRRDEAERYLEEELDPEEYKRLFAAQKRELVKKYSTLAENPTTLSELTRAAVRSALLTQIGFISFDEFVSQHSG